MKQNHFLSFLLAILLTSPSYSQVDVSSLGFNFSALVRDTAGRVQPLKKVTLRFTLLLGQNGTTTNAPYIERRNTTTDAYGFVNVTIGSGTKLKGTFNKVDFSLANYWILIEVYNTFTSSYDPLAKQALQAVPYAKVAGSLSGGSVIPPGTIVAFAGDTSHIPSGWLLCNGRELDNSVTRYQPLFNAIQYNWGTSNHANKFNIPNTSGLFLRGVNNGSGNDPDFALRTFSASGGNVGDNVGSKQTDEFGKHFHTWGAWRQESGYDDFNNSAELGMGDRGRHDYFTRGTDEKGGNETRPKNIYVNYIIKL